MHAGCSARQHKKQTKRHGTEAAPTAGRPDIVLPYLLLTAFFVLFLDFDDTSSSESKSLLEKKTTIANHINAQIQSGNFPAAPERRGQRLQVNLQIRGGVCLGLAKLGHRSTE